MKSYLFPIYSALKLLSLVALLVLVSDLARLGRHGAHGKCEAYNRVYEQPYESP